MAHKGMFFSMRQDLQDNQDIFLPFRKKGKKLNPSSRERLSSNMRKGRAIQCENQHRKQRSHDFRKADCVFSPSSGK
jgi:hypothetical protein